MNEIISLIIGIGIIIIFFGLLEKMDKNQKENNKSHNKKTI
jgi:hypothetical protein